MKKILLLVSIGLKLSFLCGAQTAGFTKLPYNPNTLAVQKDGKAVIAMKKPAEGGSVLIRLNLNGSADEDFKIGVSNSDITSIYCLPDGKILVGGFFSTYNNYTCTSIIRLNSDGTIDLSFKQVDPMVIGVNIVTSIYVQDDSKILIGGKIVYLPSQRKQLLNIARLNSDGTVDGTFCQGITGKYLEGYETIGATNNYSETLPYWNFEIRQQNKESIFIAAPFTEFHTTPQRYIVKLFNDGSIDTSFNANVQKYYYDSTISPSTSITDIQFYKDGKILVGGDFSKVDDAYSSPVARLLPNGKADPSFNKIAGLKIDQQVIMAHGLVLLNDESIVLIATSVSGKKLKYGVIGFDASLKIKEQFLKQDSDPTAFDIYSIVAGSGDIIYAIGTTYNDLTREETPVFFRLNSNGSLIIN